ncbi:MAG: type II secretion system F family protein [Candidatus Pacearchaeota archaeon]|nr:type II secretion system F family protein [Candidatus Pacearchaeota archaeon]
MKTDTEDFEKLRMVISREKKMIAEISSLENYMKNADVGEQRIIDSQIDITQQTIRRTNEEIPVILEKISLGERPLLIVPGKNMVSTSAPAAETPAVKEKIPVKPLKPLPEPVKIDAPVSEGSEKIYTIKELKPVGLEKVTLKRMKKKEKKVEAQKERQANSYVKYANQIFSKISDKIIIHKTFKDMERDLIKANLRFTSRSYISVILLSTCIAFLASILIAVFFFFFKISPNLPILLKNTGEIGTRLLISLAIIIFAPILTFIMMYTYPGMEKSSTENRIEEELPFATIHMSAISGSMIDPSKIFNIIITTHEYPFLEKEFKKLINEINLYGYDLVSALRNSAYNTPSKKLSELLSGLATTINSGGYLPEFFDKRSQTLLFENRLEQEKKNKSAETFMDIYISLVIAAPMILMILLMMMKISGLGISMSTSMITIIMVVAVTMINIVFLTFLQLKK